MTLVIPARARLTLKPTSYDLDKRNGRNLDKIRRLNELWADGVQPARAELIVGNEYRSLWGSQWNMSYYVQTRQARAQPVDLLLAFDVRNMELCRYFVAQYRSLKLHYDIANDQQSLRFVDAHYRLHMQRIRRFTTHVADSMPHGRVVTEDAREYLKNSRELNRLNEFDSKLVRNDRADEQNRRRLDRMLMREKERIGRKRKR